MALVFKPTKSKNFKVILKDDDAIENTTKEQYEDYLNSGCDESKLVFTEGKKPTYFVLARNLGFDEHQSVLSSQIKIEMKKGQEAQQNFNLGYVLIEMRYALIDIENPDTVPEEYHIKFKKDSDGYAHKALISQLHERGWLMELFGARKAVLGEGKENLKNV